MTSHTPPGVFVPMRKGEKLPKTTCAACGHLVAYRLLADGKHHVVWHKRWKSGGSTVAHGLPGHIGGDGGMVRCGGSGAVVVADAILPEVPREVRLAWPCDTCGHRYDFHNTISQPNRCNTAGCVCAKFIPAQKEEP